MCSGSENESAGKEGRDAASWMSLAAASVECSMFEWNARVNRNSLMPICSGESMDLRAVRRKPKSQFSLL